ncbi:VOC family protein [Pseudonocardia sp. CA-107938]|uniref:VOC family protein n=1 Tax=Pseudonocardia sp. CA-107938 TaxID=3240021 RepID=UPI003D9183A0
MGPVIGELQVLVLDCPEPTALARFYQGVLGGEVDRRDRRWALSTDWSTLHLDSGQVLAFQGVADHRPPVWGDPARPQQSHLDVAVRDLEAAHEEVLALGATLLHAPANGVWRVYADPAGHPFCLVRH